LSFFHIVVTKKVHFDFIVPISEKIQLAEKNPAIAKTEKNFFLGFTYSESHLHNSNLLNLGMYIVQMYLRNLIMEQKKTA
jgi:hypothetical protein